jgi:ketosteroid isomerase-like protein
MPSFLYGNIIDLRWKTGLPSVLHMPGNAIRALSAVPRSRARRLIVPALLISLLATPLFAGLPRAQKHEFRHEIDQLEEAWRTAILKGDTNTLGSLLADDYMAITPTGTLETKDETLANLHAGSFHVAILDVSDRKVRIYGDTAVVTSVADVQATTPNGNLSGAYRYTRVYVRDAQGAWKIVSFEASRITEPDPHKPDQHKPDQHK